MSDKEKLEFLRAEQIKANFLLYGKTTFALNCLIFWTGFHWHSWSNQ